MTTSFSHEALLTSQTKRPRRLFGEPTYWARLSARNSGAACVCLRRECTQSQPAVCLRTLNVTSFLLSRVRGLLPIAALADSDSNFNAQWQSAGPPTALIVTWAADVALIAQHSLFLAVWHASDCLL